MIRQTFVVGIAGHTFGLFGFTIGVRQQRVGTILV